MKYTRKRFTTPSRDYKPLWHSLIEIKGDTEGLYHTSEFTSTGTIVFDIDGEFFRLTFKTYLL